MAFALRRHSAAVGGSDATSRTASILPALPRLRAARVPAFGTGNPRCASSRPVRAAASRSGGVLDAPLTLPGQELGKEVRQQKPPTYKVMLHNDNYNRREYVVKILLKIIQGMTVDDAVVAMQEAHDTGVSMVIACPQEDAEKYCEGLRLNGLTSTIEPGR